jgi:hypothetical protein
LKGAAAGFGVITEFIVQTHPEPTEVTQYTYSITTGPKADMAGTFANWQKFISNPDLSRKFASQLILFELGMIIEGTYFGPKAEFDALGFEEAMGNKGSLKTAVLDDWLGTVANWAENEALQLVGGIVSFLKSLDMKKLIPCSSVWFLHLQVSYLHSRRPYS